MRRRVTSRGTRRCRCAARACRLQVLRVRDPLATVFRPALGRTITNLQASWVKMALGAATEALHWGRQRPRRAAHGGEHQPPRRAYHGVRLDSPELIAAAHAAGRQAAERTTLYAVRAEHPGRGTREARSAWMPAIPRWTPGASSQRLSRRWPWGPEERPCSLVAACRASEPLRVRQSSCARSSNSSPKSIGCCPTPPGLLEGCGGCRPGGGDELELPVV